MENKKLAGKPIDPTPDNIPEELLPVYDWFKANSKRVCTVSIAIILIVTITLILKSNFASRQSAASTALGTANATAELEDSYKTYSSSKPGDILGLKLAQSYYNEGRYEMAAETFKAVSEKDNYFRNEAMLGYAISLEAQRNYSEAINAYNAIIDKTSPAYVAARRGIIRSLTASSENDKAKEEVATLKNEKLVGDEEAEALLTFIDNFIGLPEPLSLYDQVEATPDIPVSSLETAAPAEAEATATVEPPATNAAPVAE